MILQLKKRIPLERCNLSGPFCNCHTLSIHIMSLLNEEIVFSCVLLCIFSSRHLIQSTVLMSVIRNSGKIKPPLVNICFFRAPKSKCSGINIASHTTLHSRIKCYARSRRIVQRSKCDA